MATKFYFWEAGTAPITPSADAAWTNTASIRRRPMHTGGRLSDTALTTVALGVPTAGQVQIYLQGISRPMAAGIVFDTSVTYKSYFQVLESAINDNIVSRCGIRILSQDGLTVRATVKAVADYSTGAEWNTALRNKAFLDGDAGAGSYTTVAGDRLCFEVGATDASGASIQGSMRFGSQDAAVIDLPEDETSTSTVARPWFQCSLDITFLAPTEEIRYVRSNGVNTAGGDGTTDTDSGANRAWASIPEMIAAAWWTGTDWATANKRATVYARGATADVPGSTVALGVRQTAPDCYVSLNFDSPSSLVYSTSYYRIEPSAKNSTAFSNNGVLYLRVTGLQAKGNPPDSGGYLAIQACGITTLEPGDIRFDRCCFTSVLNNTATGGPSGFAATGSAPNVKVTATNCVAFSFKGSGSTHAAYKKQVALLDMACEDCLAYDSGQGFETGTNTLLLKNCNAQSCTDGYSGTFHASCTNNASSLASDAPGANARNSVTTTFVSAGTDFHLTLADTSCIDFGIDLSADARLPFSTDGDGKLRQSPWDIGPHDASGRGSGFIALQAVQTAANW